MWIDTHCHLDASEFQAGPYAEAERARQAGVSAIVIPAVHPVNFDKVEQIASSDESCFFTLGIHPMYVPTAPDNALAVLRQQIERLLAQQQSRFIGIGEIGLDYFVPALRQAPLAEKQEYYYQAQLKLAREFDLPVLLHVRRSQDQILKQLRRIKVRGGIAHAFNGSMQQAQQFIELGFKLGFGGAMTFTRALQIRRLATDLPLSALVLETDAPDIPPAWLSEPQTQTDSAINRPAELPQIGLELARLRQLEPAQLAQQLSNNSQQALPRLQLNYPD